MIKLDFYLRLQNTERFALIALSLHFSQMKHRHTVGCILHVLHVSDPWVLFICIHQVIFEGRYILKMHICDFRLLLP